MTQQMIRTTCILENQNDTWGCAASIVRHSPYIGSHYKVFNTPDYTSLRNNIRNYLVRAKVGLVRGNNIVDVPVYVFGMALQGTHVYHGKAPRVDKRSFPRRVIKGNQLKVRRVKNCGSIKMNDIRVFFKNSEVVTKLSGIINELNAHLAIYGLNSCLKQAHFFAQITAESSTGLREKAKARSLTRAIELWGKRASTVELEKYTYVSRSGNKYLKQDGTVLTYDDRKNLLNYVYGKNLVSLGNYHWSDGYKFRGRGFIHLTGRANYQDFTSWNTSIFSEFVDFTKNPDLIIEPKYAARSAAYFWIRHHLDKMAENGSLPEHVNAITKVINPNMNGKSTRITYFKRYWSRM